MQGYGTTAGANYAHAEGQETVASGRCSHSEGCGTIASARGSHVSGTYNVEDSEEKYAEIVGNGSFDSRSNARTLDWSGNEILAGKLTVGAEPSEDMDTATKGYVDAQIADLQKKINALKSS